MMSSYEVTAFQSCMFEGDQCCQVNDKKRKNKLNCKTFIAEISGNTWLIYILYQLLQIYIMRIINYDYFIFFKYDEILSLI